MRTGSPKKKRSYSTWREPNADTATSQAKPEHRDPIEGLGARGLVVLADVFGQRPASLAAGHRDQAARADLLDDLDHPRIQARIQITRGIQRIPGRPHHAPFIQLGVGLGGAQEGAHGLQVHPDLGELLLDVLQGLRADGVDQHLPPAPAGIRSWRCS